VVQRVSYHGLLMFAVIVWDYHEWCQLDGYHARWLAY